VEGVVVVFQVVLVVLEVAAVVAAVVGVVRLLLLHDFAILVLVRQFLGQVDGNGVDPD
jgi:hypothetical protein